MPVDLQATLAGVFNSHGIAPSIHGEWLFFPTQELLCKARIGRDWSEEQRCVQLDVYLLLGPGKTICESCVGFGATRDAAITDAVQGFAMCSLHVLLAAFFADASNEQVTREQWVVGGESKQVVTSNLVMRGKYPSSLDNVPDLLKAGELNLKERRLSIGTHWMRLYFAYAGGEIIAEALLDNEPDAVLQAAIAAMPWPKSEEYYSARYFLVLQDGLDVSRALATISQSPQSADEAVRKKLMRQGSSGPQAQRLVALVPLAFGRVAMRQKGITFSDRAILTHPKTMASKEVLLKEDPVYLEALRIAEESLQRDLLTKEDFGTLIKRSPELTKLIGSSIMTGDELDGTVLPTPTIFLSDEQDSPKQERLLVSSKQAPMVPGVSSEIGALLRSLWGLFLDFTIVFFMLGFMIQGLLLAMLAIGQRPDWSSSTVVGVPVATGALMAIPLGIFAVRRNRSWAWGLLGLVFLSGVCVLLTLKKRCPTCNRLFARKESCPQCHSDLRVLE